MVAFSVSEFLVFLMQLKIFSWSTKTKKILYPEYSVKKKVPKRKNDRDAISINNHFPFYHQKVYI